MSFSAFDHQCMSEALRLARRGLYTTDPNPRVGCVLAKGERVLARGHHEVAGGPHAEIAALGALRDAGADARGLTAYVTLEPCSHQGRTPPCSEALVEAGVGRVVIASMDPNPLVNGGGAEHLQQAGVRVETGLMEQEAEALNPGFFQRMRHGRPWVRVKTAQSLDGRTALASGESQWISGEAARRDVQHWRARSGAILTGIGTLLADDPRMDVRLEGAARQPLRVVADRRWRTPPDCRMLATGGPVVVAGDEGLAPPSGLRDSAAELLPLPATQQGIDLRALLAALARREINELQVEAGARLCGSLLQAGLVDEVLVYQAAVLLGDGAAGPFTLGPLESMAARTHFEWVETRHVGADLRLRLRPRAESPFQAG